MQFTYKKCNFQGGDSKSWNPELIQEIQENDNNASQDIVFWMESILKGYLTEFTVDTKNSYKEADWEFFNGPQGKFLLSLQLSLKMLVCERAY